MLIHFPNLSTVCCCLSFLYCFVLFDSVFIGSEIPIFFLYLACLLASASKTYIGSVLFRASAFTGAQLASGVPAVIGRFGP